jgi:hypothetical protein
MAGLFNSPHASNYKASNVWDVVPADVTANVILATAAALGQGAASRCVATRTRAGRFVPEGSAPALAGTASPRLPARAATAAAAAVKAGKPLFQVSAFTGAARRASDAAADASAFSRGSPDQLKQRVQDADESEEEEEQQLLIVHNGSSTTYPLTIMESWNWGVEVYGAWNGVPNLVGGSCAGPMPHDHEPNPARAAYYMNITAWKIWLAAKALR